MIGFNVTFDVQVVHFVVKCSSFLCMCNPIKGLFQEPRASLIYCSTLNRTAVTCFLRFSFSAMSFSMARRSSTCSCFDTWNVCKQCITIEPENMVMLVIFLNELALFVETNIHQFNDQGAAWWYAQATTAKVAFSSQIWNSPRRKTFRELVCYVLHAPSTYNHKQSLFVIFFMQKILTWNHLTISLLYLLITQRHQCGFVDALSAGDMLFYSGATIAELVYKSLYGCNFTT